MYLMAPADGGCCWLPAESRELRAGGSREAAGRQPGGSREADSLDQSQSSMICVRPMREEDNLCATNQRRG